MILETQQNSDITYRVYDYDRLQNGQPRQLHIKQSIDVITCPANNKDLIKNYSDINSNEIFDECFYKHSLFIINKRDKKISHKESDSKTRIANLIFDSSTNGEVNEETKENVKSIEGKLNQNKPFMNVSVIEGEGLVNGQLIKKGDHFILPNGIGDVDLMGEMTLIVSSI